MRTLARLTVPAWILAALAAAGPATSATLRHTNVPDFITGISDGVAMAMVETNTPATGPLAGGVGVLPGAGTVFVNDDLSYASITAAEGAGWRFQLPNPEEGPPTELSSVSFTGTAVRLRVSKPQDLYEPWFKRSPVLFANNTAVTGDFIAETKLNLPDGRPNERSHGLLITAHSGDPQNPVPNIEESTRYVYAAAHRVDILNTVAAIYPTAASTSSVPNSIVNYQSTTFPGETWWVRVVKRGAYFYTFFKNAESAPWIFSEYVKVPDLANTPLAISLMSKSFGTITPELQYLNVDFDYFRLTRVGDVDGTFTNVFDAGAAADWQTVSLDTHSMQGLKYQMRTGNALSGGTLTDAGAFVGPDGTAATFFEDDAAAVVPNRENKRYLEYKLYLDNAPVNLPAFLREISAVYQPAGAGSRLLSDAVEFGPDAGGIQTQPGGGDLSLTRTEVFLDNFNADPASNQWMFENRGEFAFPQPEGTYTVTERPGYLRMKVGYQQNFDSGTAELGGVSLLRELPVGLTDWEIETEVTMEVQQNRQAVLWAYQDNDNNLGVSVVRRNAGVWEIGLMEHIVIADGAGSRTPVNYGSNTIQLRLTKQGQIFTLAARDTASPSPSWRVLRAINTAGQASGSTDFNPTQVGLLVKSYGEADRNVIDHDFNYFRISSVVETGTKDIPITLPAGNRADSIIVRGDAVSTQNVGFQVRNAGGTFVGPDGTNATTFSLNEPKLPASLDGLTSTQIRLTLDNTTTTGTPYVHVLGLQYALGATRIERDTNQLDFAAGLLKENVDFTATPGVLANAGGVSLGTPIRDEFNYSDNDLTTKPWTFDNPMDPAKAGSGTSRYSFTDAPGKARLYVGINEDTTVAGRARAFLRRDDPVTGDWEIESLVSFPNGKENGRITGIGLFEGTNYLIFGFRWNTEIALRSSVSGLSSFTVGAYDLNEYQLRIRKIGSRYEFFVKEPSAADWTLLATRTSTGFVTPQVGMFGLSVVNAQATPTPDFPVDYEYFTVTPISASGLFESRILDLGASGQSATFSVEGTGLPSVQVQFRASETQAGLSALPYVGPDGTAGTFFTGDTSGALPVSLSKRYVQYRLSIPVGSSVNSVTLIGASSATQPLTRADAVLALRIAGGLDSATADQRARLDVVAGTSAGKVDLLDATAILRGTLN